MFGKKEKNNSQNTPNKVDIKNKNNIKNKKKNKDKWKISLSKKINFYEDFLKHLEILKIFNAKDFNKLLEDKPKDFKYNSIKEFLDDVIIKFWEEKEDQILREIFNWIHGYQVNFEQNDEIRIDLVLRNYLDENSTTNIGKDKIQKIIDSWIIPVSLHMKDKIKKMIFISRTPEISQGDILSLFNDIIKKERILDGELILVPKRLLEFTLNDLLVKEVDILL